MNVRQKTPKLTFVPAESKRWNDLELLFGEKGACGGCWCMWWLLPRAKFERGKGAKNRRAFRAIVDADRQPGLLAYAGEQPVAWCALAPRSEFVRLENSRVLAPIDGAQVWSIPCLFVRRDWRRCGVSVALLRAATRHVQSQGGTILEGYPVQPTADRMPDAFAWTGTATAFVQAGFTVCARRSPTRPIFRIQIRKSSRRV